MAEEVAAAMAALQKQIGEMKEEIKILRRRNEQVNDEMEEDEDVWVEKHPEQVVRNICKHISCLQPPRLPSY